MPCGDAAAARVLAVRRMKDTATRGISVSRHDLAAHALRAGLVDRCHVFVTPALVGDGKRFLPDGFRRDFELLHRRRFRSGVVRLRYRIGS